MLLTEDKARALLADYPNNAVILNILSVCLITQNKFDEPEKILNNLIDNYPKYVEPYINLGALYDRQNNKYEFDEDLICTVVYFRDFNEIPEPARYYMNIKAARLFVDRLVGDQALRTYNKEDETRARAILMETDLANGDHNMLRGDPSLTNIFDTYNPSSALIR